MSSENRARVDVPPAAHRQAGAFTRQQAFEAGWSADRVSRRVRTGAWVRVAGKALTGGEVTAATLVWAVHLTWPDAVASHSTAAALHRLPVPVDAVAHAVTPRRMKTLSDLRPHRIVLADHETTTLGRGGPRLTTPARTVLDCLRTLPVDEGERLLAYALTRKVVVREDLRDAAVAGYERWGTPALRELLRRTAGGALSEGERRLHTILRAAGIGGWTANATVSDLRGRTLAVVDVLFSRERVVVEVDGWAAHGGRDAFERDRRRQNRLVTAGWTVLRFTWSDLRDRPETVAALVRAALLRR